VRQPIIYGSYQQILARERRLGLRLKEFSWSLGYLVIVLLRKAKV